MLSFLKTLIPHKKLPCTHPNLNIDYNTAFSQAVAFTKSCGFEADELKWSEDALLDKDGDFLGAVLQRADIYSLDGAAGQCLKWCHYLQPYFEEHLDCKVWLTVGQLWKGDAAIYNPTLADLERWLKTGFKASDFSGKGLNLHAWLTVENGEIIELTFPSTFASVFPETHNHLDGAVMLGYDPNIIPGHRHIPLMVGQAIVEKLTASSNVPLLAETPEDLKFPSQIIVLSPH